MPQAQRRGISSSSAPKWLPGIRKPFFVQFCRTVVAPNDRRETTSASLLLTHFSRRIQVIDIQKIMHFCLLQFDRSLSCNQLSINNFHSTHRTASSTQRRLFAKQPHIGTPYGHTKRPTSCAKGRYRAMAHRNHPHSARKRHLGAAVWRRALSWTSFKAILIGREGTFFALIDVNCLISIFYYETHTSMSSVFYESVRICTAHCCRQS